MAVLRQVPGRHSRRLTRQALRLALIGPALSRMIGRSPARDLSTSLGGRPGNRAGAGAGGRGQGRAASGLPIGRVAVSPARAPLRATGEKKSPEFTPDSLRQPAPFAALSPEARQNPPVFPLNRPKIAAKPIAIDKR